jgi:glycosyltransferase involved in cell wall biosynthesis
MKVWAYVLVWNEELMLPYYLKHYSQFCDKIIIYDNMSTDSTCDIAREYGNQVEIIPFETNGEFNDYTHIELKRKSIQHAKGQADFIILTDCDEFVYHTDLKSFLSQNQNCSVFYPAGFQMASDDFPYDLPGQLYDYVQWGEPNPWYVKPMIVNLNLIDDLEWVEGAHELELSYDLGEFYHPVPKDIRPMGEYLGHQWGRWQKLFEILDDFNREPLKMLHYKFLGEKYVTDRYNQYMVKMSAKNHENSVGMHYQEAIDNGTVLDQINQIKAKAIRVSL